MGCGSCRRFVGVRFEPRRFGVGAYGAPQDLAQNQSRIIDPDNPMGGVAFGDLGDLGAGAEGAAYVVQPGDDVRLSAIARKLGISAPEALTPSEQAAAGSWAGYLGGAKLIAAANGRSWAGPPGWQTYPVVQVGEELVIPPEAAARAENKSGAGWLLALAAGYLLLR